MKKVLLMLAVLSATMLVSCKKPQTQEEEKFAVSLEITAIENNCATINATLTEGNFYGGMIVEEFINEELTIDPAKGIDLVKFVKENGVEITAMPYQKTLEKVRIGKDRFTAIIVFNKEGVAKASAYKVWTPEGSPAGWSTENNPGELGEIEWK